MDGQLVAAAEKVALLDPVESAAYRAASFLSGLPDARASHALRRAALESAFPHVRKMAAFGLGHDPTEEDLQVLTKQLADSHEIVRVAAASVLAQNSRREGFDVLVASLRVASGGVLKAWAADGLGALHERRALAPLIRAHDDPGADNPEYTTRATLEAIQIIAGHPQDLRSDSLEAWWSHHSCEFPEQLDPESFPVAPITSSVPIRFR